MFKPITIPISVFSFLVVIIIVYVVISELMNCEKEEKPFLKLFIRIAVMLCAIIGYITMTKNMEIVNEKRYEIISLEQGDSGGLNITFYNPFAETTKLKTMESVSYEVEEIENSFLSKTKKEIHFTKKISVYGYEYKAHIKNGEF